MYTWDYYMLRNQLQSDHTSHFHVIKHNMHSDKLFSVSVSIYMEGTYWQINPCTSCSNLLFSTSAVLSSPYPTKHMHKKKNIYIAGNFLHAAGIAANTPP